MVKIATVSASDLAKHNRMDAGFFVSIEPVKARLSELSSTLSVEEAKEKLKALDIPMKHLGFLQPILRGSRNERQAGISEKEYNRLVESDTFAVMALIEKNRDEIVNAIETELKASQEKLNNQKSSLSNFTP